MIAFLNPNMGGGDGGIKLTPCWFFLHNSEAVKAVTKFVKFGIPKLPQSPDIGLNSDGGISDFRITGQSLIK